VAFKALDTEKLLVVFPAGKGLDLLNLRRRLLTAKLTGAGPNVTILKRLQSASIDKVDGLDKAACWDC
jgi:NAD(P)H-flavin reductase